MTINDRLSDPYKSPRDNSTTEEWWLCDEEKKKLFGPFATQEIANSFRDTPDLLQYKACEWMGYKFCSAMCKVDIENLHPYVRANGELVYGMQEANKNGYCANHNECHNQLFV